MNKENTIIIYSSKNVKGRKDATGAFIPEAKAFAKYHGIPEENMLGVPCPGMKADKRRAMVTDFIKNGPCREIDMIAWFGHGYSSGIQFGFTKNNVFDLLDALLFKANDDLKQVLYACSTASANKESRNIRMPGTDGGFADTLRDEMFREGFRGGWVDAHLQPGHTTKNPYILRFLCNEERVEQGGGSYLVHPNSSDWNIWSKAIRTTNLRFDFPYASNIKPVAMQEYFV